MPERVVLHTRQLGARDSQIPAITVFPSTRLRPFLSRIK
jgi:hypothetical protein